jgi:hypothetical protein
LYQRPLQGKKAGLGCDGAVVTERERPQVGSGITAGKDQEFDAGVIFVVVAELLNGRHLGDTGGAPGSPAISEQDLVHIEDEPEPLDFKGDFLVLEIEDPLVGSRAIGRLRRFLNERGSGHSAA